MTNVAETILAQLGGVRFIAMTGAKNLVGGERYLSLKLGRNASSITHMTITLRGDDTYDVLFQRVRGVKVTEVSKHEGVYVDMLADVIYNATGLLTSL